MSKPLAVPKALAEIETRTDRILGDIEKVRALLPVLEADRERGRDGVLTQLQTEKLSARLWRAQDAVTFVSDEIVRKAKKRGF